VVLNKIGAIKFPCCPVNTIPVHIVHKIYDFPVSIYLRRALALIRINCIWKKCPLTIIKGILAFENPP
jgi:hypothetical protein